MTTNNNTNRELGEAELDRAVGGNTTLLHEVVHANSSNTGGTVILGLRKSSGGQQSGVF
jgi:hypothetical protein